jgi:cytochrome c oxidase accessory protein FixG
MSAQPPPSLLHVEGRVLPTLEADGSRRWLHPRLSTGRFWQGRLVVGWVLIAIFTAIPFIHFNAKPLVLLDVVHRQFTLFGYTFLPRDTFLLALLLISWILGIFLFTAVFGRVWCGWACPQTVYMEYVYRPIERLFLGRAGKGGPPAGNVGIWRYPLMYLAFLLISLILTHTFLSYFVGVDELRHWITRSPAEHPASFIVILLTTGALMFDFCFFREQMCTVACPYGRMQSVLLDRHSVVVRYDHPRGEPRGKRSVSLPLSTTASTGDCVDCSLCVQVCPTGIDIRDGTQLECINCAQCIDACDAVMTKIGRPLGLVRYSSLVGLQGLKTRLLRPRTLAYASALTAILALLTFLLATKAPADVLLVRNQGLPFVMTPDGRVENTMRVQLTNRTHDPMVVSLSVLNPGIELVEAPEQITLQPQQTVQKPIHLLALPDLFTAGTHVARVRIDLGPAGSLERQCQLFGPAAQVHP